jgi:hypothetical protein
MLSKCANPTCSTPLIYLREGKIFMMMDQGSQPQVRTERPVLLKAGNRVEHFWLCGPCAAEMTIVCDPERGIRVVPKPRAQKAQRAAAS